MAEITASAVKELRERTGLGMMECKKALTEAGGDLKKAEELLRIKSGAKASKAAGRVAADGAIGTYLSADGKLGALVEVNSETDFVAKSPDFIEFIQAVAKLVAEKTLLGQPFIKDDKQTVEKMLAAKKAKINGYAFLVVGEGIEKAQPTH